MLLLQLQMHMMHQQQKVIPAFDRVQWMCYTLHKIAPD
jgi:hypothetical protein